MKLNEVLLNKSIISVEISEGEIELTLNDNTKLEITSYYEYNKFKCVLELRVYIKPEVKPEGVYIEFKQSAEHAKP